MHVKLVLKIEFCTTDGTYVTNICSIYAEWSKNIIHNSGRITVAEIFHANYVLLFNIHGSVHRTNILIYITQHATLHSLFYLETALHVSGGTTTHHQERKHLYLQHLVLVTPLLLPAAMVAGSSNGVTNTRRCKYRCLRSWWWVVEPPETCRAVSR